MIVGLALLVTQSLSWKAIPEYVPKLTRQVDLLTWDEHDTVVSKAEARFVVKLFHGSAVLYGVHHTYDPTSGELGKLARALDDFKPDVVLVEGHHAAFSGTRDEATRRMGEPGFVAYLATARGAQIFSWEPTTAAEGAKVQEITKSDDVAALYFTLRNCFSNRRTEKVSDARIALSLAIRKQTYKLKSNLRTAEDLQKKWKELGMPGDFREAPESSIGVRDGGPIFGKVALELGEMRTSGLGRAVLEIAQSGKRVFAVCGMSHAIRLEKLRDKEKAATPRWDGGF